MRRLPVSAVGLVLIVVATLLLAGRDGGSRSDAARAQRLTEQLRCPVCDGLAVADSPSSTARAIAADVRNRIEAGETDDDVRRAYVDQYGEWILLEPPGQGIGVAVWLLPVAALGAAAGGCAWALHQRAAHAATPPSNEARAMVARALDDEAER